MRRRRPAQEAIQIIFKMAAANGVSRVWVGEGGLLSTPAVSAVIRCREGGFKPIGGFILSASHNPGGLDEDFGIKFNMANGGPAPEKITGAIYERTKVITAYRTCPVFPTISLSTTGVQTVGEGAEAVTVEVFDSTEDHVRLLKECFDFGAIKALVSRADFSMVYDSMCGVQGPYAHTVFCAELGLPESCLLNATPLPDFGGPSSKHHGHADPNLTHAVELIARMGLDKLGNMITTEAPPPTFGAAADGDADRNMILGANFFVTPSDSLAVIAANADCIPYFAKAGGASIWPGRGGWRAGARGGGGEEPGTALRTPRRCPCRSRPHTRVACPLGPRRPTPPPPPVCTRPGLRACARSMPTSCALDLVAATKEIECFEVPTGWKFFGNLMDSGTAAFPQGKTYTPFLCGEESFGTGSNHVREKDGMWAVLAWLQILAVKNSDANAPLVGVADVVREHWRTYGRNYYARYDYEGVAKEGATQMMAAMAAMAGQSGTAFDGGFVLKTADEFTYKDPVDGSVSEHQGIRFLMTDGSRIVFRLSGTGVDGATVRLYLEKYEGPSGDLDQHAFEVVKPLAAIALSLSKLTEYTGRTEPSVIT